MNRPTMKQPNHESPNISGHWVRISRQQIFLWVLLPVAVWLLAACGWGSAESADAEPPAQIRAPRPTFTPTPRTGGAAQPAVPTVAVSNTAPLTTPVAQVVTAISETQPVSTVTTATETAAPPAKVKAIVNTPLVNIRSGPGTDFSILTTVDRGEEYEIVGKTANGDWWKVCCVDEKPGWVNTELVDTDGQVDAVPVEKEEAATEPASATPVKTVAAATTQAESPTATAASQPVTATTPAATFPFELIAQEQFPESKQVRIFLYVYDGDNNALEGYSLRVTKDGNEVPVNATSFGGRPGFTWPVADVRQRFQNMKVEFPGVTPAGAWTIQLIKDGQSAGPAAAFTLKNNEPNEELYVRYEQHK